MTIAAITCPSCHRACHQPHCQSKNCPWKRCPQCEAILGLPYGRVHAISVKVDG